MNTIAQAENFFLNVYKRFPFEVDRGEGVYLFDKQGKKYLDFLSGIAVNALGHQHPKINRAILEQLNRNLHLSNYFVQDVHLKLASLLIEKTGFSRLFFTNSGTEAIEGLLKVAKKWGREQGKTEIVALQGSFHGRTLGALSITMQEKYQKSFRPLLPNVQSIPPNDLQALKDVLNENTLAVFYEGIMGEGGVKPLNPAFLDALYQAREQFGFLIFADEIQTGVGRTGAFYYFQKTGHKPDGIATAKGLGGGLPLGAFLLNEKLSPVLTRGEHGTTYGGNPLACAAGLAVVQTVSKPEFLDQVTQTGKYFEQQLQSFRLDFPELITDVRGVGLMLGMEVKEKAAELMFAGAEEGLIFNVAGGNTLRFVPPLIIKPEHVDEALQKLRRAFLKVF